jgi:hypothetical protein
MEVTRSRPGVEQIQAGAPRCRRRRLAARAGVAVLPALALTAASALLPPGAGVNSAAANITCSNTFHLHWGTKHNAAQRVQVSGGEVYYWWSYTWAGTGQTYLGSIFCPH